MTNVDGWLLTLQERAMQREREEPMRPVYRRAVPEVYHCVGEGQHHPCKQRLPLWCVWLDELMVEGNRRNSTQLCLRNQHKEERDPVRGPPLPDDDVEGMVLHRAPGSHPCDGVPPMDPSLDATLERRLSRWTWIAWEQCRGVQRVDGPTGHVMLCAQCIDQHRAELGNPAAERCNRRHNEDAQS